MKRKQLARDRLFRKAELLVNATQPVLHEENAGAIVALPQVRHAPELDRDRMAKFFLPALGLDLDQIIGAQLNGEIAAAIPAPVAGIPLLAQCQRKNGKFHRGHGSQV